MKSIIVGTDFSEGSYVALELAVDVANRMACGITVVWVKREKKLFSKEQLEMMTNLAKDKLQTLCDKHRPALKYGTIEWKIINGRVSTAIADLAIHWLRQDQLDDAERLCRDFLAGRPLPAPVFRLADCKYPVHPEADSGGNGKKVR